MDAIVDDNSEKKEKLALTSPKLLGEQPGGLRSETRMTIQTRQAQKLVLGRKRTKDVQPIIGLLDFGRRMKLLWLSAQADDPYADWYLLQIEEAINEAKLLIIEKNKWLNDVLNSMDGFEISTAQSLEPIKVPIVFQNPYGYMGAYLIAEYDGLCCSIFTASHIGLIDRKTANALIEKTGKSIRRTFNLATKWKFTGVTREDISNKNPNSVSAIETYGECPEPVLKKTKRAKISPEIRTKQKVVEIKVKRKKGNVDEIKSTDSEDKLEPEKRESEAVSEPLFGMV